MSQRSNHHSIKLRVRYAETDQMGVVYYANYLVWFEMARTEFFRARGVDYSRIEQEKKIYFPVIESYCRYRSPLKYDDIVTVTVKLRDTGNSRIAFEYEVKKAVRTAATGHTTHTFVNKAGKPIPIPADVKKALSRNS